MPNGTAAAGIKSDSEWALKMMQVGAQKQAYESELERNRLQTNAVKVQYLHGLHKHLLQIAKFHKFPKMQKFMTDKMLEGMKIMDNGQEPDPAYRAIAMDPKLNGDMTALIAAILGDPGAARLLSEKAHLFDDGTQMLEFARKMRTTRATAGAAEAAGVATERKAFGTMIDKITSDVQSINLDYDKRFRTLSDLATYEKEMNQFFARGRAQGKTEAAIAEKFRTRFGGIIGKLAIRMTVQFNDSPRVSLGEEEAFRQGISLPGKAMQFVHKLRTGEIVSQKQMWDIFNSCKGFIRSTDNAYRARVSSHYFKLKQQRAEKSIPSVFGLYEKKLGPLIKWSDDKLQAQAQTVVAGKPEDMRATLMKYPGLTVPVEKLMELIQGERQEMGAEGLSPGKPKPAAAPGGRAPAAREPSTPIPKEKRGEMFGGSKDLVIQAARAFIDHLDAREAWELAGKKREAPAIFWGRHGFFRQLIRILGRRPWREEMEAIFASAEFPMAERKKYFRGDGKNLKRWPGRSRK